MKIWPWERGALRNWFSKQEKKTVQTDPGFPDRSTRGSTGDSTDGSTDGSTGGSTGGANDTQAHEVQSSLRELLHDNSVPDEVRAALENEFDELRALLKKIEQEEIHIVVFGRVSVGKSSLLNALMGENHFAVSPLHGETKQKQQQEWQDRPLAEHQTGGVHFIDTPGIDEVDGDTREWIARKAAQRADIILFVVDSDLTQTEFQALQSLKQFSQPMLLILNKADQYSEQEQTRLLKHLKQRVQGLVDPEHVLATSARSVEKKILLEQADGSYLEQEKILTPEVNELKDHIWHIVEHEGRTLAALNASLFASDLSDDVGKQVLTLRRELANKVITNYSLSKGLAVAANPIPIADLVAAAGLDVSMIIHLSRLHGLPMTREEAGDLFKVIITQLAALMGSTWAINALSTALKVTTAGLSTVLTAAAQGSIAYYATVVLGRVAETWLAQGKSWGKQGPKVVVKHILNNLDKKSILQEGRQAILEKLSRG